MTIGRLAEESEEYRRVRDELQEAEKGLRDQRERVAALRRQLPLETMVDDPIFEELRAGARSEVRLSALFTDPSKPLVLMHFMYGKKQTESCPMCTMWADGYNGVVRHLRQQLNFAVLVAGDIETFTEYADGRGWGHLRLVSAAGSDLKRRLGFEGEDGAQLPGVSVFVQEADDSLRHFYSQSALMGDDKFRGMDLLSQVWHFLDLTPDGRGDWFPKPEYPQEADR